MDLFGKSDFLETAATCSLANPYTRKIPTKIKWEWFAVCLILKAQILQQNMQNCLLWYPKSRKTCVNSCVKKWKRLPCAKTRKVCVNVETTKSPGKMVCQKWNKVSAQIGRIFHPLPAAAARLLIKWTTSLNQTKKWDKTCDKYVFINVLVFVFIYILVFVFAFVFSFVFPGQMDQLTKSDWKVGQENVANLYL